MWNSEGFYDKILEGWERSETRAGIPYYVNHQSEKTQWDHPLFVKTVEEMVDMDNIKYAAYRTSMKLRFLQNRLGLDLVDIRTIDTVFERHGYQDSSDTVLDCSSLYGILVELLGLMRKPALSPASKLNTDTLAELLLNWLLCLFDTNRTGCIRVLAVKVALATLCSARLSEKYRYYFHQLRDSNNHISPKEMGQFLHDIMQIPEQLSESISFGGLNVGPAVESCFNAVWTSQGVTEDEFISWLLKEPQTIVWLPTLHRMAAAESVKHDAQCNICKTCPIIGFRYRCLKCFNYDVCQQCFFIGRVSKKHKLKHPTQEYCIATSTKEDTKALMRTIRNNLSKKHRNKRKLRYLPIEAKANTHQHQQLADEVTPVQAPAEPTRDLDLQPKLPPVQKTSKSLQTDMPVSPIRNRENNPPAYAPERDSKRQYAELLRHLENENRQLMKDLERASQPAEQPRAPASYSGSETDSEMEYLREERERMEAKQEVLEAHNKQLEMQLHRLRLLLKQDGSREPLTELSQNTPVTPSFNAGPPPSSPSHPPPPYHATPTSPSRQPLSQSMHLRHPFHQSGVSNISPIHASIPTPSTIGRADNQSGLSVYTPLRQGQSGSFERLEVDTTYGLMEPSLGRTHFSLPSPSQSRYFPDEEAELEELMDKLDQVYPHEVSRSMAHSSQGTLDEMYRAANQIGYAFTDFVGSLQHKERLAAAELDDGEDSDSDQNSVLHNSLLRRQPSDAGEEKYEDEDREKEEGATPVPFSMYSSQSGASPMLHSQT